MTRPHDKSPDRLILNGQRAQVRRLNRVPILIVIGIAFLVAIAIGYTYSMRMRAVRRDAAIADNAEPHPASADLLFKGAPSNGLIAADPPAPTLPMQEAPVAVAQAGVSPAETPDPAAARARDARYQAIVAALTAPTSINARISAAGPVPASIAPAAAALPVVTPPEGNGQAAKRAFLDAQPADAGDYLTARREQALTQYDLKAGAVIPAVMVSGIDSDLPGQIVGQVSENVYDSATGRYLLIPQGAKLIGTYDSALTRGQDRVLVVWRRVIFPDASSLDLGSMPGTDDGGYAGFTDQVDNHYLQAFGSALLLSAFSAGIQISQPQAVNGQAYSSSQIVAGAVGQQLGALGSETARRNMDIQPTVTIRPGYRFAVMVTKDIALTPWRTTP